MTAKKTMSEHFRSEYAKYRAWAKAHGFMGDFKTACAELLDDPETATPGDWAEAAEGVWADTEAEYHYYKKIAC